MSLLFSAKTVKDRAVKMATNITSQQIKLQRTRLPAMSRVMWAILSRQFCYAGMWLWWAVGRNQLLIPLKGQTHCELFERQRNEHMVSVATDVALNMRGTWKEFVTSWQTLSDPKLLTFHCILQRGALCTRTFLPMCTEAMNLIMQPVNKVMVKGLHLREFSVLLDEVDST